MTKLIARGGKLVGRGGKLVGRTPPAPPPLYFEMIVKTDNSGTSGNNQFTIPTTGIGYNYAVETSEQLLTDQTGNVTLEWDSAGTYWVRITGDFPRIYFNNGGDRLKLLEVSNWGNIQWGSMGGAFSGCSNFNITAADTPDLSNVVNMSNMFWNAFAFNSDIGDWDVSSVTNMGRMFRDATAFNSDIGGWDVSSVTNMSDMFWDASAFNSDIGGWNVGNVTNMSRMFRGASAFNSDIGGWDVSSVTNMGSMFLGCSSFNSDIGGWDVSSVTNMSFMFFNTPFNGNIGSWDVSSVTNMGGMFQNTIAFNRDLSGWCVEQIVTEPENFDTGADSWVLPRPNWGEPC